MASPRMTPSTALDPLALEKCFMSWTAALAASGSKLLAVKENQPRTGLRPPPTLHEQIVKTFNEARLEP
jgi:hypothetical protein